MSKKIRITQALLDRLETEGVASLVRSELRTLFRRGYVEKRIAKMDDGSERCVYKVTSNIL